MFHRVQMVAHRQERSHEHVEAIARPWGVDSNPHARTHARGLGEQKRNTLAARTPPKTGPTNFGACAKPNKLPRKTKIKKFARAKAKGWPPLRRGMMDDRRRRDILAAPREPNTTCNYYTTMDKAELHAHNAALDLLITTNLEALASANDLEGLALAGGALQTENDLLGRLGLFVEDGLCLTTITTLLSVVTSLTLGHERGRAGLVLRHFLQRVLAALGVRAEGLAILGDVDLQRTHAPFTHSHKKGVVRG